MRSSASIWWPIRCWGTSCGRWERDDDALVREFSGNARLRLTLDPGLESRDQIRDRNITDVRLEGGTFGDLDLAVASEIIAYLTALTTTETSPP